jgi:hypothetical protein
MSLRYQGGIITTTFNGLLAPDAPTIGTASAAGSGLASVAFTAPSNVGGGAITGYTVLSSPGGFVGTGASSPVTVSGLTNGTAYTFTAFANNTYGNSPASAASNSVTPAAGDPYWANVTLLVHGNTNGSDSSTKSNTLTATATNATIDTSVFKFGGGSFKNTSNTGSAPAYYWYNTAPASNSFNFGTGAFTIEFFSLVTSTPRASEGGIVSSTDRSSNVGIQITARGVSLGSGASANSWIYDAAGWRSTLIDGSWHYVVAQRDGSGNWRIYLDGSLFASGSGSTDNINTNQILVGLTYSNGEYAMNGYVDELRVTYGVARYPSSITSALAGVTVSGGVPTGQFPDF